MRKPVGSPTAWRTFYCQTCQSEQSIDDKVKVGKHAIRCRSCLDRADRYRRTGESGESIYSSRTGVARREDYDLQADKDIPTGVREAYIESITE